MNRLKTSKVLLVSFAALCVIAINTLQSQAFSIFGKKETGNVYNIQEKYDYVNIDWWNNFSDPYLKNYVIQALNCNHDLKQASWKVEEYRQTVKTIFSKELPSLNVGGNYYGVKFPDIRGLNIKNNIFTIPLMTSYEADIFLKNHDKTKSSKKGYQASKFEEKSIYISLVTDVSTTYLNIIKFDKQIALQCELVDIKKEKLKREYKKFKRGTVSATDLNNSQKEYETAKSNLEELIKSRDKALTQLAILVGESPDNICNLKRAAFDSFEYKAVVPSCIPSDVIFSRPDVLATEAKLEKSNIDVRVARKEFLPTFPITGILAFSNLGVSGFGSWGDTLAAIAVGTSLDLFKGGFKVANLRIYKSRYEQMFEEYKQVDLNALKEVNDSLMIVKQDTEIDNNTIKSLKLQEDSYNRANNRYKSGVISCPQLLTEKELVIANEQNQVNTKATRLVDYLTLYKAVGGKL